MDFSIKKLLFGSINKKFFFSFSILILLLVVMASLSYNLNKKIADETKQLREVEAPLEIMAEKVIGYDAMLTSNVEAALLHSLKNDTIGMKEHKTWYDGQGILLDNLLKIEAPKLMKKSKRSEEQKQLVYGYLKQLDEINLKLVDLETRAFTAMKKGDNVEASFLIVGDDYQNYKAILRDLYDKWKIEEKIISESYRQKVLKNSKQVIYINIIISLVLILLSISLAFFTSRTISKPIKQLYHATQELEKKNFKVRVDIKTNDELEELGTSFNRSAEVLDNLDIERKQIDSAKTKFLSITSHELRSPMTPMKAQLEMLLKNYYGKLTTKQKQAMDIILNNTNRLDRLLVDFLELSRIEAARLKFNFVRTDLANPLKKVVTEMKNFMPEKNVKIILNIQKLPTIEVDPDRTMQVLRNLLNNAIKFSKENSRVVIDVKKHKNLILFSVKDFGVGISLEDQMRMFEPFFQAEGTIYRKYAGTGLGLALCKGIIESQNGKIWVESVLGKGSTFYFTIPLKPVTEIKPIKLLFTSKENIENRVEDIFKEILGPLGKNEFEGLRHVLTKDNLFKYINSLVNQGIISGLKGNQFKENIQNIFGEKKRIR
ncbi:MAG: HAMP domain-containing sensor histidine kinase [Candidatus Nanoarchaeia archaeon]